MWWKGYKKLILEPRRRSSLENLHGSHRCYHSQCRHYAYGFETAEALQPHLQVHWISQSSPPTTGRNTPIEPHEGELDVCPDSETELVASTRRALPTRRGTPLDSKEGLPTLSHLSKRGRDAYTDICLRCKILKKGVRVYACH
jgi:hypothetical protein